MSHIFFFYFFFFFNDTATTEIYTVSDTLSLHDALRSRHAIARAMSQDRLQRFATVLDFAAVLERAAPAVSSPPPTPSPERLAAPAAKPAVLLWDDAYEPPPVPDGRLVRRVALGAVLMILLAGAAGFGLWLAGRDAAPVRLAVTPPSPRPEVASVAAATLATSGRGDGGVTARRTGAASRPASHRPNPAAPASRIISTAPSATRRTRRPSGTGGGSYASSHKSTAGFAAGAARRSGDGVGGGDDTAGAALSSTAAKSSTVANRCSRS